MKKLLKALVIGATAAGLLTEAFLTANAITCTNVFPTALNGYSSSSCIASAWANALETKVGVTGSAVTTTLDYQVNHVPTSSVTNLQSYINSFGFLLSYLQNNSTTINGALSNGFTFTISGSPGLSYSSSSNTITLTQSTSTDSVPGFLSAADHTTFNAKLATNGNGSALTGLTQSQVSGLKTSDNPQFAGVTTSIARVTNLGTSGCLNVGANSQIGTTTCAAASTVAGTEGNVQFNSNGLFTATSSFSFATTTQTLSLSHASSTLNIGTLDKFSDTSSTQTFAYTGASSTFTVPSGVYSLSITAIGASGGMGQTADTGTGGASSTAGMATGTISVTPGQVLYYNIGGAALSAGLSTTGGYGGGGAGAVGGRGNGAGGGGMTWVSTAPSFATSSVLVVGAGGGGGGGAAGTQSGGLGGGGGATTGVSGGVATNAAGTGGTQSAGGTGANAGTAGQGGASSAGSSGSQGAGGGGGAGYFGGGGGNGGSGLNQGGSGGGGGSSFVTSTAMYSAIATSTSQGNGSLVITYSIPNNTNVLRVGGHILTGGTAPTPSTCGTNPSVSGTDTSGKVTLGTGGITACTLTFAKTFTAVDGAPDVALTVASSTAAYAYITANTSSSITFGLSSTMAGGTKVHYIFLNH